MYTPLPEGVRSIALKESRYRFLGPIRKEGKAVFKSKTTYDKQGRILKEETEEEQILFHYSDRHLEEKETLDREGNLVERCRFLYDADGFCTKRTLERPDSDKAVTVDIEVQQNGRLIIEKEGKALRAMQYNSRRLMIKELLYTGKDPDSMIHYAYDEQDRLIKIDSKDATGKLRTRESRLYSSAGLLTEQRWENQDGELIRHLCFDYPAGDDAGWLICQVSTPHPEHKNSHKKLYKVIREINYYPRTGIPSRQDAIKEPQSPLSDMEEREFPNGRFIGQLEKGAMEGRGEFHFNDGSIYKGEFSQNRLEGKGELIFADGRVYRGMFKNSLMHGSGLCQWPNGETYRGAFQKGEMHGVGEFTWSDGQRFKGWFEHNVRSSQGVLFPPEPAEHRSSRED